MKTIAEIEKNIFAITLKIANDYPELSKYITEIPLPFSQKNHGKNDLQSFLNYYDSLEEILTEYAKTHTQSDNKKTFFEEYPHYPASEDIYFQNKEEKDLDPEDISKNKTPNELKGMRNEKSFSQAMSGSDLDIPGTELDDVQEEIGSEDEENNYYSIGGDNHNDLDEDNG